MKLSKSLLATAALLLSTAASADEWIGPYSVEYVENGAGALFFMRDVNGFGTYSSPSYSSCNRSTIVFQSSLSDIVVSRTLAIALAAQTSGIRVKFLINGCLSTGPFFLTARAIAIDTAF